MHAPRGFLNERSADFFTAQNTVEYHRCLLWDSEGTLYVRMHRAALHSNCTLGIEECAETVWTGGLTARLVLLMQRWCAGGADPPRKGHSDA